MKKESTNIWERLYVRIKNLADRFLYYDNLFDENVWQIRFSKLKKEKLKYQIAKEGFSFKIKSSDDIYKYLWMLLLLVSLVGMLVLTGSIGISDREVAQDHYSNILYNHFHHIGDNNVLDETPYSKTQAQTIDLIIFATCKALNINKVDTYTVRHIVSTIFGWLLVAYLSLILLRAFNWRAAFFTAFFLIISPRFLGYSLSNVVDVTFAFFFIFSIMQMYYFCRELPVIRINRLVKIVIGILLTLSVHNAGSVLLHFLIVFTLLNFFLYNPIKKIFTKEYLLALLKISLVLVGIYITVFIIHTLSTLHLTQSFVSPIEALATLITNIPYDQNQIFEGHIIGPDNFPKRYLIKYLYITTPTVVLISFLLFFIFFKTVIKSLKPFSIFIFIYTFLYFVNKVKVLYMNPDTLWAIEYCIYPLFMLLAASGIECALRRIADRYTNFVVLAIITLLSLMPIRHIMINKPFTSLYFNEISGGIHNAYTKYALDSNFEANKMANAWILDYIKEHDFGNHYTNQQIVVATNGNDACNLFYLGKPNYKLIFNDYDAADSNWHYYVAYCNHIPITQLRNGMWPADSTIHIISFEQKPMVAFYRNEKRFRQWAEADSIAMALDSLNAIQEEELSIAE